MSDRLVETIRNTLKREDVDGYYDDDAIAKAIAQALHAKGLVLSQEEREAESNLVKSSGDLVAYYFGQDMNKGTGKGGRDLYDFVKGADAALATIRNTAQRLATIPDAPKCGKLCNKVVEVHTGHCTRHLSGCQYPTMFGRCHFTKCTLTLGHEGDCK